MILVDYWSDANEIWYGDGLKMFPQILSKILFINRQLQTCRHSETQRLTQSESVLKLFHNNIIILIILYLNIVLH
jgi:hypothetical protein